VNKPSRKQLESLVRLQNDVDFGIFMGWVRESRDTEALLSINIDKEPQGTWMQGRVQQLSQIIDAVSGASSNLEAVARYKGE
jgi:hypothetical protein